ncbi:tensin-4-like isoform X3 [Zootermopsis nevadensis]|uniref:tensin-4-like isoform X3 n=1 Tax=Zootermopsis nevadensis TaxID=136037 RepID=UPI000B8EC5E8|nr:tensin-4-like isoform X3 [Zootermopsis nevadensis]
MALMEPHATRTLALNGLTITATLTRSAVTLARKCRESCNSVASAATDECEDLPDGSCFRRTIHRPNLRRNLNEKTAAIRAAQYMGSFPVAGPDQASRAECMRTQLQQMRGSARTKSVLLVISLAGIKVCSPDGKSVHMAHALRRISYATCDPDHAQFSFLAREPKGHFSLQYCHSFLAQSADQAEELNSIVGNAFRMAYAAQLQRQPTFQDVIASQLQDKTTPVENNNTRITWTKQVTGGGRSSPRATDSGDNTTAAMNVQLSTAPRHPGSPTLRLAGVKAPVAAPPTSIPGLRSLHNFNNVTTATGTSVAPSEDDQKNVLLNQSQQSTPSSDESNSPTDLNSYKRLTDKPPLIKRLAMGLSGGNGVVLGGGGDDSCPLVVSGGSPTSPSNRPLSGGYVNEAITESDSSRNSAKPSSGGDLVDNNREIQTKHIEIDNNRLSQSSPASTDQDFKSKRISQISSCSSGSCPLQPPADGSTHGSTPTPPPLPERTDSLNNRTEEGELRAAPWFQAGIPREITLEVLGQEPVGAFMVRESTSKPGCYALSLRVPRDFQPSGIAHYLIMRTNKGYKIKGFTKEFSTLTALITHHSVMPELLPCPLSLSRYNPSFAKSDSSRDFADIDSDPDYNTLADFRKMMADLNV